MKNGKSWEEQKKEKKYCPTYWAMKLQLSRITHAFNQDFQLDKVISANKTTGGACSIESKSQLAA